MFVLISILKFLIIILPILFVVATLTLNERQLILLNEFLGLKVCLGSFSRCCLAASTNFKVNETIFTLCIDYYKY